MTKEEIIGWLWSNSRNYDWSLLPKTMKMDFSNGDFLLWCRKKKDFRKGNNYKPGFNEFYGKIGRALDFKKSEAHLREIEKRERNELVSLKDDRTLYVPKKFSVEEIEKARRNKSISFPWRSTLKNQVQSLQEILKEFPEATIVHDYEYTVIITGKDTFEETEARLREEEQKEFERSLKNYNRWAELSAKYGD